MNSNDKLAEILPDGISESTMEAILEMVDSIIEEQVGDKVALLEAKVNAFLRQKVDRLKEQALAELSEESEVFRNARLFESVRTLMSLELNQDDEENAVAVAVSEQQESQEELEVLTEQLQALLAENENLENTVRAMGAQVQIAESNLNEALAKQSQLLEEVENLEAIKEDTFHSSEKAVMISESEKEVAPERTHFNEFLTDEVMRFMPFNTNN